MGEEDITLLNVRILARGIDDVGSAEERKLSLDRNLTFALVPWSDGSVGPVGTCWRSN